MISETIIGRLCQIRLISGDLRSQQYEMQVWETYLAIRNQYCNYADKGRYADVNRHNLDPEQV